MSMNQQQLECLCRIAHEAGQEIMEVYGTNIGHWNKVDDSPLTEADLRADRVIRQGLEQHFPGVFILSEESRSAGDELPERFFLVDPLDGTKEFLKRNDEFTVNIALVENGVPVVGVVLAPALGECFYAARGLGAFKRDGQSYRAIATAKLGSTLRVMGSRSHGGDKLKAWLVGLSQPYDFVAVGSSLKFCRIAEGAADIYPRFGPTSQWDTAAAQAVLEIAGGTVTDLHGQPLRYGLQRPILNPEFIVFGDREKNGVIFDGYSIC
ncbi:3'(2'),5'-bisphosphate nucleotidase CysQ [Comamonas nitrativorans]|uniref:3'(2'),5'-bisphosphate nucleotidase CysQ n=1 Tax=Comamonas nitrativorans TaxID=108437 RepID=A0ABV9GT22_9BURK